MEPVFSEDVPAWVGCHVRAFEYFGGVSELVVPDNLKAVVTRAYRYEPDLNSTYADLARHYGFAILPARPQRPRDKAKVEVGVLLAERWILAALHHRRFASLAQVREAVKPLLENLNTRPMRKLDKSRWALFEQVEKATLRALPARPYELAFWKKARVNINYHVVLEGHWYSVPYTLVGKPVELRHTESCVEVFLGGRRVASHVRSPGLHRLALLSSTFRRHPALPLATKPPNSWSSMTRNPRFLVTINTLELLHSLLRGGQPPTLTGRQGPGRRLPRALGEGSSGSRPPLRQLPLVQSLPAQQRSQCLTRQSMGLRQHAQLLLGRPLLGAGGLLLLGRGASWPLPNSPPATTATASAGTLPPGGQAPRHSPRLGPPSASPSAP
ncbi:hypothetical protein BHS07_08635 [Myxococcus xanthus]|nr:hypothetical protein BHS07_08635 [Myxococcus xanthus]QDE95945.1 hypothetical protein BHS05_08765 [Myxococcus xanthus]